jgi:hypothetical protein
MPAVPSDVSSSSFNSSTYVSVSTLRYVFVGNFLARVSINLHVLDAMASILVDLIEADLFGIGNGRIQATGQVTSERRKNPFPLARGAIQNTPTQQNSGFKTMLPAWFQQIHLPFFNRGIACELFFRVSASTAAQ